MYQKKSSGWKKHIDFILLDLILIQLGLIVGHYLRFGRFNVYDDQHYLYSAIILGVGHFFIALLFSDNYKNILKRGYLIELKNVLAQITGAYLILLIYYYISKTGFNVSRSLVFFSYVASIIFSYLGHLTWKKVLKEYYSFAHYQQKQLLLVVSNKEAEKMVNQINKKNVGDVNLMGIVLPNEKKYQINDYIQGVPVLYTIDTMIENIQTKLVDEVLIYLPAQRELAEKIIDECTSMGITTHYRINLNTDRPTKKTVERNFGYTMITEGVQIATPKQVATKRIMDFFGSIIGLAICLVLTIIVGPIIFFSDPGPIFFSQMRVGTNGRQFKIYKFRSMYKDAEKRKQELMKQNEMDGYMFKMENDPRIIGSGKDGSKKGIGWFIRKTSIDEFPQFWNVFLGQMSIVGTRPPTLDEWERYDKHHRARLAIKPGITGLWQVSGRSEITDFEEVVKLDMEYINNWSIIEDIKIIAKTVGVVLAREGAK